MLPVHGRGGDPRCKHSVGMSLYGVAAYTGVDFAGTLSLVCFSLVEVSLYGVAAYTTDDFDDTHCSLGPGWGGGAEISTVLRLHLLYRVLAYTAKHVSVYVLLEMMFDFLCFA